MASRSQARRRDIEPGRLRDLVEHVRRRAFERIGPDFEVTDARYDDMRQRCREERGTPIGTRGHGEIWRLQVWGGVVLYAIYVRDDDELVTIVSEAMFLENWIPTHDRRPRRRK